MNDYRFKNGAKGNLGIVAEEGFKGNFLGHLRLSAFHNFAGGRKLGVTGMLFPFTYAKGETKFCPEQDCYYGNRSGLLLMRRGVNINSALNEQLNWLLDGSRRSKARFRRGSEMRDYLENIFFSVPVDKLFEEFVTSREAKMVYEETKPEAQKWLADNINKMRRLELNTKRKEFLHVLSHFPSDFSYNLERKGAVWVL